VPIKGEHGDTEAMTLAFCLESEITKEERYREKLRTMGIKHNTALTLPLLSSSSTFRWKPYLIR